MLKLQQARILITRFPDIVGIAIYLDSLLGAEVAEGVLEMFLYPARQLVPLVGPTEALIREYHYTVVGFTAEICYYK